MNTRHTLMLLAAAALAPAIQAQEHTPTATPQNDRTKLHLYIREK